MFDHLDDPNPTPVDAAARSAVEGRRQRILRRRRAGIAGAASLAVILAAGGVAFAVSGNQRAGQSIVVTTQPKLPPGTTAAPSTVVTPTTASSLPPTVTAATATTIPAPPQALVCGKLDASTGPASATATDGTVTAVLSGDQTTTTGVVPYLANATLTVRSGGRVVLRLAVAAPPKSQYADGKGPIAWTSAVSSSSPVTLGPLCLARFAGSPYLSAVFTYFGNGAHCCAAISAVPVTGPDAGKQVFLELVDFPAVPEVQAGNAVLVTEDYRFAYAFDCFACSGQPIEVYRIDNGQFGNHTRAYPDLITADAAQWWTAFQNAETTGGGEGELAAWVADKCLLGQKAAAFSTLDQLNQGGKLRSAIGSANGSAYISQLRTFLAQNGYC